MDLLKELQKLLENEDAKAFLPMQDFERVLFPREIHENPPKAFLPSTTVLLIAILEKHFDWTEVKVAVIPIESVESVNEGREFVLEIALVQGPHVLIMETNANEVVESVMIHQHYKRVHSTLSSLLTKFIRNDLLLNDEFHSKVECFRVAYLQSGLMNPADATDARELIAFFQTIMAKAK